MTTDEVRKKYIEFFTKRKHIEISPAPLIPTVDTGTLFTPFGMQQLVPYLLGKEHPEGNKLVNSQPSIRVDDIEEVGDNRHTTFFEMLGNWSLGDYFKEQQLGWLFEFLTDVNEGLGLDPQRLYVSVFGGDPNFKVRGKNGEMLPLTPDIESIDIWKKIFRQVGIKAEENDRIRSYPAKKNWWSMNGTPENMPIGDIGGPDSEVFFDFGAELKLHEQSPFSKEKCHPNCDCGRFIEIGNSVFMQYKKINDHTFEELPNKNVDFGGGLERIVAATNNEPDIFKIDVFQKAKKNINESIIHPQKQQERSVRIILDHIRAAMFLVNSGVVPSNKLHGYVLRRLIRRAVAHAKNLNIPFKELFVGQLTHDFKESYPEGTFTKNDLTQIIVEEIDKFEKTLEKGLKEASRLGNLDGKAAFDLFQTYGFPLELTLELAQERQQTVDVVEFKKAFAKHQEKSRTQSAGIFKGGLADHSAETTQLHTATHLLHAALRKVLGEHVSQKGSNITNERLRFDFTHDAKLTDEEITKIESLINEQIAKDLPVSFEVMTLEEAKNKDALAFFGERYQEKVKVYTIGDPEGEWFSKEVCGGPHVTHLSEISGHVRISREESVASGVRRLYAVIENK